MYNKIGFLVTLAVLCGLIYSCQDSGSKNPGAPREPKENFLEYTPALEFEIKKNAHGRISGSVLFPSEAMPSDLRVAAKNLETNTVYIKYFSEKRDPESFIPMGPYEMLLPPGSYLVCAQTDHKAFLSYKAFYNDFVRQGLKLNGGSHDPLIVELAHGADLKSIDPTDWYNR